MTNPSLSPQVLACPDSRKLTFELHRNLVWAMHGVMKLDAALGSVHSALHWRRRHADAKGYTGKLCLTVPACIMQMLMSYAIHTTDRYIKSAAWHGLCRHPRHDFMSYLLVLFPSAQMQHTINSSF